MGLQQGTDPTRKSSGSSRHCYHCGSTEHRARACPDADCRLCGERGHDPGSCPRRTVPPVDLGSFSKKQRAVGIDDPHSTPNSFTYVELFAGVGGFRVALDRLGGRCVFASEWDRFARKNYMMNHGDLPAGDITKVSLESIPQHDVLVGGFPCQPFSSSGKRQGFQDEKNRGNLFLEIVRILRAKQPRCFLLENVRGLQTHDGGRTLDTIVAMLQECGYPTIHSQVLDAVHLVPQERKRLYIVGIRHDLAQSFEFPGLEERTLDRGFGSIRQLDMNDEWLERLRLTDHQFHKVRSQVYTQTFPGARFLRSDDLPTKTLQSSYARYMVGSQFVSVEPVVTDQTIINEEDNHPDISWRKLSPREAARLQGFPETFQLCMDRPYHLLGNAVVPSVIALVAAPMLECAGIGVEMEKEQSTIVSMSAMGWHVAKELLLEASPQDERREELESLLSQLD